MELIRVYTNALIRLPTMTSLTVGKRSPIIHYDPYDNLIEGAHSCKQPIY
jgi:hypothetical protein